MKSAKHTLVLILMLVLPTSALLGQDINRMNRNDLRELAVQLQKLNDEYNSKILVLLETESILKQNVEALKKENSIHQEYITSLNNQVIRQQNEIRTINTDLARLRDEVNRYKTLADSLTLSSMVLKEQFEALQDSIRTTALAGQSASTTSQPDFLNNYVKSPTRLQNNAFEFELSKILYGNLTMIEGYFGDNRDETKILSGLPEMLDASALTTYEANGVYTMTGAQSNWAKDGLSRTNFSTSLKSKMPTFHILQNKFVVFKTPDGNETPYLFEYGPMKYGEYSSEREKTTANTYFRFTSQAGGQNLDYSVIILHGEAYIAMQISQIPISIVNKIEIRPIFRNNTTWECDDYYNGGSRWAGYCEATVDITNDNLSVPSQLYATLKSRILTYYSETSSPQPFNIQINPGNGYLLVREPVGLQKRSLLTPESMIFLFKLKEIAVED